MYCSSCGHANAAGAKFCESCGKPMPSAPSTPGAPVKQSPAASLSQAPAQKSNRRWLIVGGIVVAVLAVVGVLVSRISGNAQNDPKGVAETYFDRLNQQDIEGAKKTLCLSVSTSSQSDQAFSDSIKSIKQNGPITYKTKGVEKTDAGGTSRTHVYLDVSQGRMGSVADVTTRQTDEKWCIEAVTLSEPELLPPTNEAHNFGDSVQVGNRVVTLNGAQVQGDTLIADFTLENKDSSDWQVGHEAMFLFSATNAGGDELRLRLSGFAFSCESSPLGSVVAPGAKIRGNLCWSGIKSSQGVKIFWGKKMIGSEKVVVWELK